MNRFVRDRVTWFGYILVTLYGVYLNMLGPIAPFMKSELGLSYTLSSLHFSAFAAGILVIGFAGNALVGVLGRRRSIWLGVGGGGFGSLLLAAGRTAYITIPASFVMGLLGSFMLVMGPLILSERHGDRRSIALAEGNVMASSFAALVPLLVGWAAASRLGWRVVPVVGAAIPILLFLMFNRTLPEGIVQASDKAFARGRRLPHSYWVFWTALMFSVSVEFCMIFWGAGYLHAQHGLSLAAAAAALSLFLGGMIVGRLLTSILARAMAPLRIILGSALLALAGFSLFWLSSSTSASLAGLFLTGLGVAALYPLIQSLALGSAKDCGLRAAAGTTLASGSAIFALPLVLGRFADFLGIGRAFGIVGVLLLAVFLVIAIMRFLKEPECLDRKDCASPNPKHDQ